MDNRKNHEVSTSFGEVMRTAGIPTQQQYNKEFWKKAIAECKRRALILAMGLYLALDGKWTQR